MIPGKEIVCNAGDNLHISSENTDGNAEDKNTETVTEGNNCTNKGNNLDNAKLEKKQPFGSLAEDAKPKVRSSQITLSSKLHKFSPLCSNSKDDASSGDSDDTPKPKKNKEALYKLNLLLKSMTEEVHKESPSTSKSKIGIKLAKPPVKQKLEKAKKEESIVTAAKKVAEELGGDTAQTESELLNKLLSPSEPASKDEKEPQKPVNLRDLLSGMKIDRTKRTDQREEGRAQQVRRMLGGKKIDFVQDQPSTLRDLIRQGKGSKIQSGSVDIFGAEPLGIFKTSSTTEEPKQDVPILFTWDRLAARELKLAITHPPSNIYEEMIQWTEQGKLWHFPIDNEQGMEEEKKVYFTEHVFLEHHLDPWCPKKGPVRHFMELVCVGLSKNPYITVKMKLEHIDWFRKYFEDKKKILEDTGAIPIDFITSQKAVEGGSSSV